MSLKWPPKDKDETLDYSMDWSRALDSGETIQSVVWYVLDSDGVKTSFGIGVTVDSLQNVTQSKTNTVATIRLSGGVDNQEYTLYCATTSNTANVRERVVKIRIREYN